MKEMTPATLQLVDHTTEEAAVLINAAYEAGDDLNALALFEEFREWISAEPGNPAEVFALEYIGRQ